MKRENILINEDHITKRVAVTKFTAPGEIPTLDSSIHFGEEIDRIEIQNCHIEASRIVKCSPDDTYDFETGALIALMKMCGSDKVVKACNEAFSYETDIKLLRKDNNDLREANKGMQEEIKRLKGESEKRWKIYQRNIQKKQDRINKLEAQIKVSEDDKQKNIEYYEKEIKNLNYRLTCEKLQHGYNDTDMIFVQGRQNGKQYTFLVDLFKRIDKKKVDAAYKEAYGSRVIWCSSQLSIKDTVDELIKQSREFTQKCVDEWLNKPLTKREEMWGKILGDYKIGEGISIKVEKPFINDFLSEAEDNGLVWANGGEKPTEWDRWESWRRHDYIVFSLFSVVNPKELTWNTILKENTIDYLPPMRWDLFKKGRLVVGVRNNNELVEFRKEVERNTGIKNIPMCPTNLCLFYSFDKDDYKIILETVEKPNIAKINGHKVVYWEDVR